MHGPHYLYTSKLKNIMKHFYQFQQTRFYKLSYDTNRRKFCLLYSYEPTLNKNKGFK